MSDYGLLHNITTTSSTNGTTATTVPRTYYCNLNVLSEELDRRMKETQTLQDEVENSTKMTMEQIGCKVYSSSPSQIMIGSLESSEVLSQYQQCVIQPPTYGLALEVVRSGVTFPGKDVLENAIEDYFQQLSDLQNQMRETHEIHEQQKFIFHQSIINLQTMLQEVHTEKDCLSDLRMKESRKQTKVIGKMHAMIQELQATERTGHQRLLKAEDEAKSQCRRAESLERTLQEVYSTLSAYDKRTGSCSFTIQQALGEAVGRLLQDLEHENHSLRERLLQVEEEMETWQGKAEILLKGQRERKENGCQISVYHRQIIELEVALSILRSDLQDAQQRHEDKVGVLEKQLDEARSQVVKAQRGTERSLQHAEELDLQLCQLTGQSELRQVCKELSLEREQTSGLWEKATGHRETVDGLHDELEVQQLELMSQSLLDERNRKLKEAQRGQARPVEGCGGALGPKTEERKGEDKENRVNFPRLQMENTPQATVRDGHSLDPLHNKINEQKLEIQQLRAGLEQRELRLSVLEQECRLKQASLSKQTLCVEGLTLEKQQLTAELERQHSQLVCLTEEYEEHKKLQSIKSEEQGVLVSLKTQLKTTRAELDQARITLMTLEGVDGHGLKIAMGMQKQITDRREQIDTLQGQIQILEETLDQLTKEKHCQSMENKCRIQELASVTEEKRQLAAEVDTLRSLEKQLREKVAKLENTLHKMSESFVNCQDVIQMHEQEFVRLKLQHALDIKELQGQNRRTTGNAQCSTLSSPTCWSSLHSTQHDFKSLVQLKPQQLLGSSTLELKTPVKELQGGISENPRPHTNKSTQSILRRSAPEKEHQTTLNEGTNSVTSNIKSTTKATYSRTTDLDKQNLYSNFLSKSHNLPFAASLPCNTSSPRALAVGRRSPVHSLLTSDPNPTP
ncbi:coiled-coil domain-containing protein 158 isoform X1 [Esox lucius]|uniref:Coiled-coil domain-containing protein 158-like n=2 Tax=Esox lucius TaxID=8010 RepID=A0A3P9A332_ESOLU|nr:coiled-coil domain-containing protein 158 isoform X1 [Esox lucius]